MGKISIVGLGPGDYSLISQGALDALSSSSNVYLRTKKHPTVDQLSEKIQYTALDYFYEKEENGLHFSGNPVVTFYVCDGHSCTECEL